jgi:adenylate cyclase
MLFAAVAVVAIGIGVAALAAHALRSVELNTVDTRFSIRGRLGDTRRVVVVAIDSRTFSGFGNRVAWPFPRRYEAKVIDRIAAGKPAAVAVDIQFTEPTDPKDDNALIESVAKAGRVVLAATEVDAHGNTNVFGGSSVVKEIGAHVGSALLAPDADGVIRHVPNAVQGLTTFGIAAAAVARDAAVPAAQTGSHWIDFAGPPGTIKTYSFSDVYSGKVPARAFRGKVVVVGPTAPSLQDVHATSYGSGSPMSGAEIQANVVESALRDFPLSGTPTWLEVVLIAFLGIVPASTYRFRALATAVAAVVVGGAYTVSTQLAFDHGTVLPFTYPMLALALSTVGSVGVWYVLEVFERARTRDVFARFVPEAVVDQVLQRTGGELRLGGETVFGTVMFTDLRGFTSFSEGRSAEQVIGLLNRYLASMSDAVLAHGGTLVTYTGDGMMAVFGAPLPQDDHADRALGAAREMLEVRLPEFNDWLATQGEQKRLKMGVGLNSGEFMSGNVGSERRLEYTAIGDTINTASRIEGMTKGTPYALFMASSTRETLREPPDDLVYVDEMAVRGRSGTIQIWSVSSELAQKADWRSETSNPDPSPA